jgi:hypothetical protein
MAKAPCTDLTAVRWADETAVRIDLRAAAAGGDKMTVDAVVLLYDCNGLGLILAVPSGVRYRNQAAGHACWKFEIEGVLVPIPLGEDRIALRALEDHFDSGWESLDVDDADAIDGILAAAAFDFVKVDRTRLHESYEAWVHVRLDPPDPVRHTELFIGLSVDRAVLTWENSD